MQLQLILHVIIASNWLWVLRKEPGRVTSVINYLIHALSGKVCRIYIQKKMAIELGSFYSHQTVRGLYVWCQGCNHGGHLEHMREWFNNEAMCPTGCGHSCTLPPLITLGPPRTNAGH